jgi:hypothetical protein
MFKCNPFACRHGRTSFPQAAKGRFGRGEYVACLDCGREFAYDWKAMRIGAEQKPRTVTRIAKPVQV